MKEKINPHAVFCNRTQLAWRLGISVDHIRQIERDGTFPKPVPTRPGVSKSKRYLWADVVTWYKSLGPDAPTPSLGDSVKNALKNTQTYAAMSCDAGG